MILNLQTGVIVAGSVARDAEMQYVGAQSTPKARFSVQYDYDRNTREAKWANCEAWSELANVAAGIRRGDRVLALGHVEQHDYNGKTYKTIVCDWVGIAGGATGDTGELPPLPDEAGFTQVSNAELPF